MKTKTKIITWIITIAGFLDIVYGVIVSNSGLLAELGFSEKTSKLIVLGGLIWNAFSEKLVVNQKKE